jgi:glutamate-1-semialdehyde 2,1-aminomutase
VLIAPYNDLATVEALLAVHADTLAAVIVEPFQRLSRRARLSCRAARGHRRYEIPLIFDEVVTGFRFAYGGAQEYYGVVPDLAALGKIIGGGFPLAAVCGREEIMKNFDPRFDGTPDFIAQVGTLNGNPNRCGWPASPRSPSCRKPGAYRGCMARAERCETAWPSWSSGRDFRLK